MLEVQTAIPLFAKQFQKASQEVDISKYPRISQGAKKGRRGRQKIVK